MTFPFDLVKCCFLEGGFPIAEGNAFGKERRCHETQRKVAGLKLINYFYEK